MLNKILILALNNRLIVLLGAVVLCAVGLFISRAMTVDVFPDLTAPTVTIMTEAHGFESEEVERRVTYPLETALNGAPNLRRIRSSSAAGISIIWVEFEWGTDIYKARQIVNERIPIVRESLPDGVGTPTLTPISSIMGEVMLLGIHSKKLSPMELNSLAFWKIAPRLKSVGGIANVTMIGGERKQFQVLAQLQKMRHFGITLEELAQKVKESNQNVTGGFFQQYGNQYFIKGTGRVYQIHELENAIVKIVNGQAIRVRDVAHVQIHGADKIGEGSLNASSAVVMTLTKQPEVNTLALTEQLEEVIKELQTSLKHQVKIESHLFRQADFIQTSIDNLKQTLIEGAFFVVLILFIFLMNWRTTIISLLAIPLSLIVTIIVLHLGGYTINTMSLGGMAIAIGALVDDAIIDVENVFQRLKENFKKQESERQPILQVILFASYEIRSSIIIATLIIIVAFVPLFFLSGMEGRLLQPLGIAFIISILTSLLIAVTLTPVMCYYLLGKEKIYKKKNQGTFVERFFQTVYARALDKILFIPKWTILTTTIAFIVCMVGILPQLGRSFLPDFNEGAMVISLVGLPGMSLEESNKLGQLAETLLLEMPEIKVVSRRTGRSELDEHAQGPHSSEIDAPFTLGEKTKAQFFAEVREKLMVIPGVNITLGQPIEHRIDHMLSGTRANIAIKIFGYDLQQLFRVAKNIESLIVPIPGLADVAVEQQIEVPQIKIIPKRNILAAYGMSIADLMHQIEMGFGGEVVGQIYEAEKSFDLVVRYDTQFRGNLLKTRSALIDLPNGEKMPLMDLAEIQSVGSPHTINRENVARKVVVSANVAGRDLRSVVQEIQQTLNDNLNPPEGIRITYGGQFESEEKASQLLMITAIVAILVILLLLYFEFQNLKLATIVLLNMPLAWMGGIIAVAFTGGILSIASMIGFISLFGIASRNGILLISRFEDLKNEGMPLKERIKLGAIDRLNPILMTALTTTLALIPLAIKGDQAGNEIQSPMAVVILGGLVSATLLNLLVIPCVYLMGRRE